MGPFSKHAYLAGILAIVFLLTGCEQEGASGAAPSEPYTSFFTPIPTDVFYPSDNPYSDASEKLGELLFWDPILSGQMNVACASCHHPDLAWADGLAFSIGVDGIGLGLERNGIQQTEFHAPSVLNVAFTGIEQTDIPDSFISGKYFWDLRADTLEDQALQPIENAVEMRGEIFSKEQIFPEIITRLSLIPEYVQLFEDAFGEDDPITTENIAKALATFQRKLITQRTRFDAFLDGDNEALTSAEITGLNKFINAGCTDCHFGPLLSDFTIHEDQPVIRDKPAVRTPSLRNVELTPPYMHDGSRTTLRRAVSIYEERGDLGVTLEDDDFGDIERFLRTLTDTGFYRDVPEFVPSNLPVGGDILQ